LFTFEYELFLLNFDTNSLWNQSFGDYYLPYGVNAIYAFDAIFYMTGDTDLLYYGKFDIDGTFVSWNTIGTPIGDFYPWYTKSMVFQGRIMFYFVAISQSEDSYFI